MWHSAELTNIREYPCEIVTKFKNIQNRGIDWQNKLRVENVMRLSLKTKNFANIRQPTFMESLSSWS
jgi:hypothetical protein